MYDVTLRFPDARPADSNSFHVALYQLELCTKALVDGKLDIDLGMSDCRDREVIVGSVRKLKCDMWHVAKREWLEIGRYLYGARGSYLKDNHFNCRHMEHILQIQTGREPAHEDELISEESFEVEGESLRSGSGTDVASEPGPLLEGSGDGDSV